MALLMPEDKHATRDGLLEVLSEYYNSPGRLAIFRRKFDSVVRRNTEDPGAFATELEILAVRGFGDVGLRARTRMVRDRFISGQRDCGLRRHLDSVPPDTSIRDILDRCRVRESHSEKNRKSPPGTDVDRKYLAVARVSSFFTDGSLGIVASPAFKPEIPVVMVQDVVLRRINHPGGVGPSRVGSDYELWGFPGITDQHI